MRGAHEKALSDFRGENMKLPGQRELICALQGALRAILRRNMLQISGFQKNFTNPIFSR